MFGLPGQRRPAEAHRSERCTAWMAPARASTALRLEAPCPDDPCRYLTAAARAAVVADPAPDAPRGDCKAVVRFNAQAAEGSPLPKNLGAAKIYLRDP